MDRPFTVETAALAGVALVAAVLGAAGGHATGFAFGALADAPRDHTAQLAHALTVLFGASAALTVTLRRIPPSALRDRVRGCAWVGAPDPAISHAFLFGGVIAVVDGLVRVHPGSAEADWHVGPAMVLAFAAIAVVPVLEELLLRGLLFATLRGRVATAIGAITAAVASAPLPLLGMAPHPGSASARS